MIFGKALQQYQDHMDGFPVLFSHSLLGMAGVATGCNISTKSLGRWIQMVVSILFAQIIGKVRHRALIFHPLLIRFWSWGPCLVGITFTADAEDLPNKYTKATFAVELQLHFLPSIIVTWSRCQLPGSPSLISVCLSSP